MSQPFPFQSFAFRELIDVSRLLEEETAVFPGDRPFRIEWTERKAEGGQVNLSCFHGSPHAGTHVDSRLHVRDDEPGAEALPLPSFFGPARVIEVTSLEQGLIPASALDGFDLTDPPRILLKTGTDPDSRVFNENFAGLSTEAARRLVSGGAILVGLDTPSMDSFKSQELDAHHALLEGGLVWIEGLDLSRAQPGLYTLVALPLRVRGADATPVRAVLLR